MKKIMVLLATLILSVSFCSCEKKGNTPDTASPVTTAASSQDLEDLPDDLVCTEFSVKGKKAEITEEENKRLVEILRDSYRDELPQLELAVEMYNVAEYSNGMSLIIGNNDSGLVEFAYPQKKISKIVSISEEDVTFVLSLGEKYSQDNK